MPRHNGIHVISLNFPEVMHCTMKLSHSPPSLPVTTAHLVKFGLLTGEGESESQWKLLVFDAQLIQETGQALGDMVKKLERRGAFAEKACTVVLNNYSKDDLDTCCL